MLRLQVPGEQLPLRVCWHRPAEVAPTGSWGPGRCPVPGGMQEGTATATHGDTEIGLTLVTIFRPANPTGDNVGDSVRAVKLSLERWVPPQPGHAAFLFWS